MTEKRQNLLRELLGERIPRLWCPPLTHYTPEGALDRRRIAAHWTSMLPNVHAFLIPGSTGDGWEMSDDETHSLLDYALERAENSGAVLLIGVLRTDAPTMCKAISETMTMLRQRTGVGDTLQVLKKARVCGFAVCPPCGAEMTQEQIQAGLESVLELGLPTALYQLPQVTKNEMSPSLIARFAGRYANFVMVKDSSWNDRIALDDRGRSGLFLVRGAEGDYAEWLQESGGPYHGLLLSTANCLSAPLKEIVDLLEKGRIADARNASARLTRVMDSVFALVRDLPKGNPFANANKAMDHFMAHGQEAERVPPPMLHAGVRLPEDLIRKVGEIVRKANLVPARGYLDA
jgi:dihydrodipicolinate synthase/N-acetylneuraminate lyase